MSLKAPVIAFGDVLDLCLEVLLTSLAVRHVVCHLNGVAYREMIENLRAFLDQYAQTFGRNVPKLELVKRCQAVCGELDAVIPLCQRSFFRSSIR